MGYDGDPLDIFNDRLQAPGYSYRKQALIASLLIWSWVIALFIYLFLLTFFLWLWFAKKTTRHKKTESILYYLFHAFFLGIFLNLPILLLFPVIFDYLNVAIGIVFTTLIAAIGWIIISPTSAFSILRRKLRPDKYGENTSVADEKKKFWKKPWKRPIWFWGGLILCFLFGFMLNFFLEDGCFATQPTDFSFKVTRRHDDTLCDYGPPCHVYLTFGDQMTTAMIVNFQIRRRVKEGVVYFDTHPRKGEIEDYRFRVTSDPEKFIYMDIEEDRYVYWIELHGLEPDTKYYFITGGVPDDPGNDEGKRWFSNERWFKTGPLEEPFVFVSGGDMGATDATKELEKIAASYNPLFIAVGGDISYANTFPACYRRWDQWFNTWEEKTTTDGRMLPMLLGIGNHEGGFLVGDREDFLFYLAYFPFQYGLERKDLLDRNSYHNHVFGKETLYLMLDSAHLNNPKSQEDFIINSVESNSNRNHRLVSYHVPFWAPVDDYVVSYVRERLKDVWRPLFDKYNFDIAFQHHDHLYGRTKKLRGEDEEEFPYSSNKGTVYTNSGCMGVEPWGGAYNDKVNKYLELQKRRHLLVVEVRKKEIDIKAVDAGGDVFDEFVVNSDEP